MRKKSVQIVCYDPAWLALFEKEAEYIREALGSICLAIYHFGSTAVPGLSAKPKIDIMAVVVSFSLLDSASLVELGYEVRRDAIPTGKYFSKTAPRTHLHVFEEGNPLIQKNLLFRDWLRTHPEDQKAYAALKEHLAPQYDENNGMAYCYAKTEFIESIIQKARS